MKKQAEVAGGVKVCPECGGNVEVASWKGYLYYLRDGVIAIDGPEGNVCCYFNKAGTRNNITLYRGLGLPEKAIEDYEKLIIDKESLYFTGFTATSLLKKVALEFAWKGSQRPGQVPVLFVMKVEHKGGEIDKAFLHDQSLSAYPKEQEYLLG